MRILFISNYYPPFEVGGYEQLCRDIAIQMLERGHEIRVLTSNHGVRSRLYADLPYVCRDLRLHIRYDDWVKTPLQFLWRRPRAEAHDLRCLRAHVAEFRPDAIFIWNLEGLPRSLATAAESLGHVGTAYWLAGRIPSEPDEYWQYWTAQGRTLSAKVFKTLLCKPALATMRLMGYPMRPVMRHVAVVSEYMQQKGIAEGTLPAHTRVIHNGVELDQFITPKNPGGNKLRLLLAGRLSKDKGVHTAIEGLNAVVEAHGGPSVHLIIVGKGPEDYRQELLRTIAAHGLDAYVTFRGWADREVMPHIMADADVLLLPSIYPEALPRVVLEAMASGLAVIATPAGGTGEIVEHNVTGLLCAAGDSADLASQIERLLVEPGLRERLAAEGQRRVVARFSLEAMADHLEALLTEAVAERRRTV